MPPQSVLPRRLPSHRLLVLGIIVGLVALFVSPASSPAWAQSTPTLPAEAPADSADSAAAAAESKTVVFGIPGLTIGDIDPERTPNLFEVFRTGAAANLNVRTIGSATCPASGWLSFGSGARAEAGPPHEPDVDNPARCPALIAPSTSTDPVAGDEVEVAGGPEGDESLLTRPGQTVPATIPDFDAVREPNQGTGYTVDYGMLSRLVGDAGAPAGLDACVAAEGPGAAYAVADENGQIGNYTEDAIAANCRLALVDLGSIGSRSWLFDPIPNYSYTVPTDYDRRASVEEADRRLGDRLEQLRSQSEAEPTVIIAGLGDSSSSPRLRAFLASGPGFVPGTLSSASTRTEGLLQITDLAPGILERLGIDSPSGISLDVTPSSASPEDRRLDLETEATKSEFVYENLSTFSLFLDIAFYVLVILCGLLLSTIFIDRWAPGLRSAIARRAGRAGRSITAPTAEAPDAGSAGLAVAAPAQTTGAWVHRTLAWIAFVLATIPMGAFLAGLLPWARFPHPQFGLFLSVALGAAAMLLLSLLPPWGRTWRGRVAALSLLTVVIIAVDLATGSRLQANSLLGYNPIVGGRYYGLGNQGAAIFIASLFVFLGLLVSRLRAAGHQRLVLIVPAVIGLAAVFVSGNPSWGAKFGGTIATLAGLLVLLALVSRIRLSLLRLGLIGVASLAALIGIAFLDWLRPAGSRSHFGNFFDQLVTGEALQVVGRKLSANLHIIQVNPALSIVTPLAIIAILVFLRYLLHFPRFQGPTRTARFLDHWRGRLPEVFADEDVHFGFLAAVTGLTVGLVLTDSGIAVPSTGAMVLLPYLLALCADGLTVPHGTDTTRGAAALLTPAADATREPGR
ncbi:hypothetical protein [Brevibacterium casei]|uniref:Uncharacterized protein n=1 Tax=Brevibacterium casei TaxID=33889 RepID=A0A7T3ZZA2_9MICO|nr:hypothetical protein [Brevibacterium casei]QQB14335.1 hypothetical protein I6H47_16610 [Brevibacterium casei]